MPSSADCLPSEIKRFNASICSFVAFVGEAGVAKTSTVEATIGVGSDPESGLRARDVTSTPANADPPPPLDKAGSKMLTY
jgi:hypothetical protein